MNKKRVHIFCIISSWLMIIVAALGTVKYFYYPDSMINTEVVGTATFNFILFAGLGVSIRFWSKWVKFPLLILAISGLYNLLPINNLRSIIYSINEYPNNIAFIAIMQRILLTVATSLLFIIPKPPVVKNDDNPKMGDDLPSSLIP